MWNFSHKYLIKIQLWRNNQMDIRQKNKPRLLKSVSFTKSKQKEKIIRNLDDLKGWIVIKLFLIGTWVRNITLKWHCWYNWRTIAMDFKLYNTMITTLLSVITVLQMSRKVMFLKNYSEALGWKLTIMVFKMIKRALYT